MPNMKVRKPKSKRVPVRLRHKIEKASAAKQRKERKIAKNNPQWKSRIKKDPGIPNLFPYKDRILHEIEEKKRIKEEENMRRREEAKATRNTTQQEVDMQDTADAENEDLYDYDSEDIDRNNGIEEAMDEDTTADNTNPMAALLASARSRASAFNKDRAASKQDNDDSEDNDSEAPIDSSASDDEMHGVALPDALPTSRTIQNSSAAGRLSHPSHAKSTLASLSRYDVVLYILDARDPAGTRSAQLEQHLLTHHPDKRLILVLNKIDLVPAPVLQSWTAYLRRSFPVLPLRCSTSAAPGLASPLSESGASLDTSHLKTLTPRRTAEALVRALKAYAASAHAPKSSITVGILGFPNVGKSSVVNALTGRFASAGAGSSNRGARRHGRECPTGAEAGITTALREVKLDGRVKLVDSPGVVFPSLPEEAEPTAAEAKKAKQARRAKLVLLNALPPREISEDPVPAVTLLLQRLLAQRATAAAQGTEPDLFDALLQQYSCPALLPDPPASVARSGSVGSSFPAPDADLDLTNSFLLHVARARGRLGRGGVPNLHSAAQTVLGDWRDGRVVGGWTLPPVAEEGERQDSKDEKVVVSQWAEEFKIDGLWGDGGDDKDEGKMDM